MDLEPSRKAHYERAAKRYDDVRDEPLEAAPLPTHLRHDARVVEVWHVDLVEWEQRGSAAEACAEIVLDGRWPDPIRRQAMIARLTALGTERDESGSQVAIEGRARLAGELAQVPLFVVLSPLERLFARPERAVKLAVLVALKSLFFKRSLTTVVAATREPDPVVAQQAGESLKDMIFPHAFDPLARVVRESNQANARVCALTALAQIETPAAAELLLGVLEHGAPTDRDAVRRVLHGKASRAFLELARNTVRTAPAPLQQLLREALGAHGSA
jgi:HEAT repeat protein